VVTTLRALWVDDDREERFQYELSVLADHGLTTDWALDAAEAVARLSKNTYDLVLLDQVFPISQDSSYKDVWSGCRLLYWLRGLEPPGGAPQGAIWAQFLRKKKPRPQNKMVPVVIISGFQDDHVDEALTKAARGILIFAKPVDGDELIAKIKKILIKET
jgi:DNA-binding response OmpR family regulator